MCCYSAVSRFGLRKVLATKCMWSCELWLRRTPNPNKTQYGKSHARPICHQDWRNKVWQEASEERTGYHWPNFRSTVSIIACKWNSMQSGLKGFAWKHQHGEIYSVLTTLNCLLSKYDASVAVREKVAPYGWDSVLVVAGCCVVN